ncbi:MAG: helix-turn-helix domain-containing protein [Mariprofundales bacterium]
MTKEETRQAILIFHQQGISVRKISRRLKVARNTVRGVIHQQERPVTARNAQLLQAVREAFTACRGNAVRIAEVIASSHGITIPYSTLTRIIREENLRQPKRRSGHYTHAPGEEMQHDTSPHRITLGKTKVTAQCASLVFAYSRKVYIQYYPNFTCFEAKVFLDDALRFFDGSCARCVIDNTSVVLASGCGADAIINPEMAAFGRIYGFHFIAHSIGNPNRKAHVERAFHYVEHNFLPGRSFLDWRDLNSQARQWCNQVANQKAKRSLGMSPDEAFIMEKPSLLLLPAQLPPVYQGMDRIVDISGYVNLDTNRYSVPEHLIGKQVMVHKYLTKVVIFFQNKPVAEHERVIAKRHKSTTDPSHHKKLDRKEKSSIACSEETALRGRNATLDSYLNGLKKRVPGRGVTRLRRLLNLQRSYPEQAFMAALQQALAYGMYDLTRLERLILKYVAGDTFQLGDDNAS